MYKNQKTFTDIDFFLRDKGFQLYGLYPNYISAKKLDRRSHDSEERIIWADVVYFKDPLSYSSKRKKLSKRDTDVLLLAAILTRYYDFALEILDHYYRDKGRINAWHIKNLILSMAKMHKRLIEDDLTVLIGEVSKMPKKRYLLAKKFIDRHKSNNNIDFITI